jgi:hypothetical protein
VREDDVVPTEVRDEAVARGEIDAELSLGGIGLHGRIVNDPRLGGRSMKVSRADSG